MTKPDRWGMTAAREPSVEHVPLLGLEKLLVLLCVSVPSFMINLDSNIVAVSLPSIARSLHADFASIEWVISAYTLTFASLVMPAGALADRYGRRRTLLIGLTIFTLASLLCGAAPNATILNAARALQGAGAALQLSAALAIMSHGFRGVERARAFAFWGSVIGVAVTLGPVAGGIITQFFGWEWAFYVNVPVGIAIIGLTLRSVRESRDPNASGIDIAGVLTFSLSLFLLTLGLISGNSAGWTSGAVRAELVGAVAFFAAFLFVEARQQRPMLDLGVFRLPTFVGSNIVGIVYAASFLTMLTFLPLYFQGALGASPIEAGLLMLPMAIPLFVVPRLVASRLTHLMSGRLLLAIGLVLVAVGLVLLGLAAPGFHYRDMLVGMLIVGTAAGILNGEVAKVSMSVIPPERAGMASGVSGTGRFSGIVIGFAALGAILYDRVSHVLESNVKGGSSTTIAALARGISSGNVLVGGRDFRPVALLALGQGYQTLLWSAALLALVAAGFAAALIRTADTLPIAKNTDLEQLALPLD